MKIGSLAGVIAVLALGASSTPAGVAAAGPIACDALAQVALTNGTMISAEPVEAGAFAPPASNNPSAAAAFRTLPAFCRVSARLTPTPDSDIRIEVWLPRAGWNRKVQAVGNGGLGGTMPYAPLAAAVRAGYAAAGTDTGHVGGNGDFVPGHPEKLVDFAYRAIHEMTVAAKAVVTAHYDARPVEIVLQLLLDRRPPGAGRGATLPGGLRRHRCRRRLVGPDAALRRSRRAEPLREP